MTGSLEHARAEGILAETAGTMVRVSASEALGETTPERETADASAERAPVSRPQSTVDCRGGFDYYGVSVRVRELWPGAVC